jgi:hypothetical protein
MQIKTLSSEDVLGTLRRDGICVLDEVLAPDDIEAIRKETEWFLSAPQSWYRLDRQGPENYDSVSPRGASDRLLGVRALFSQKFFETVCKGYLGDDAIIDRTIFSHSQASERPITLWHADQQAEGWHSFKFMLYLTDTSEDTGAFSYIPGSHEMMRAVMRAAAAKGVANIELHSYAQIADAFERFGSDAQIRWFKEVGGHISGDFASDDQYSVAAKKGSILLFDTKGIHRGGVVRHGERMLVRIHCFEPERRAGGVIRGMVDGMRATFAPKPFGWG